MIFKATQKNAGIKQTLINVISSYPCTDIGSISLISNTLSSLTSNPNDVSISSAVFYFFILLILKQIFKS